jgi:predicted ATPase
LAIALDETGRPFVESEVLKQRRKGQKHGRPYPFLRLHQGKGMVWAGEEAVETEGGGEDRAQEPVELTDLRQLGIATLGTLKEHPRIKRFRDFLKGWYLSYFYPDAARSLPSAGPQKHLNSHGDNIGNVVQFMEREHKDRFKLILDRIAAKIPGVKSIDTEVTIDKRVVLRFNDGTRELAGFQRTLGPRLIRKNASCWINSKIAARLRKNAWHRRSRCCVGYRQA